MPVITSYSIHYTKLYDRYAVTLGLGISLSFFTAVMVTRLMIVLWIRRAKPKMVTL